MTGPNGYWSIKIGAVSFTRIQLVLSDRQGWIADRVVYNGRELNTLLNGWQRHYGCSAHLLFKTGFNEAKPDVVNIVEHWNVPSLTSGTLRCMPPELFDHARQLAEGSYRPREISELKEQIAGETRAVEVNYVSTGIIDDGRIHQIVDMKLELDGRYIDWVEGHIG